MKPKVRRYLVVCDNCGYSKWADLGKQIIRIGTKHLKKHPENKGHTIRLLERTK